MTTTFTAMPIKMTASAMRFLGCVMASPYSRTGARFIDRDQVQGFLAPLGMIVEGAEE